MTVILAAVAAIAVHGAFLLARAASIPATVTATPAVSILTQSAYRWYGNVDGLDPTTPLASEDAPITAPSPGTQLRIRMNIRNSGGRAFSAGAAFKLQYANATSGPWNDVSTSTAWAFLDNPSVADGQIILTTLLASSTAGESYGESNPSAASPMPLLPGDYGEWDWALVSISANTSLGWFFRMTSASGTVLDSYDRYPALVKIAPSGGGGPGGSQPPASGGGGGGGGGIGYLNSAGAIVSALPHSPPLLPARFQAADFEGDNRIDIVDLSILLYHYGESVGADPEAGRYDLNNDGSIDFPDVSILMYYWTGT